MVVAMPMREAVRAMRRAISPRLAIRREVMGVGEAVLSEEDEVVIAAVVWVAGGGRIRGAEEGRRGRDARRRWWVRLRDRILGLMSWRGVEGFFEIITVLRNKIVEEKKGEEEVVGG